jgi:phospholipase/carboxylesterase
MKTIETSLAHRILIPSGEGPHPGLVLLHGRGADENDLLGLSEYLSDRLFIMSVRAPFPFPYGGGYTWYDVGQIGTPEPGMFTASYEKLTQCIDDALKQYPIDAGNLFLLGFSMGTVMSFALALTHPSRFRGVSANSGYVPEGTHLTFDWQNLSGLQVLITHGEQDPVIPVDFARRARQLFSHSTAQVTYREYQAAHHLSDESLTDITTWMNNLIEQPSSPHAG